MNYYNRYAAFQSDGQNKIVPGLKIDIELSDLYLVFDKSKMRLDNLSYKYYGDPNYGWLLMLANPAYGSMEFSIPDGVVFRIPYPLSSAIGRYETAINRYNFLNK